jgi:hypothetical protein
MESPAVDVIKGSQTALAVLVPTAVLGHYLESRSYEIIIRVSFVRSLDIRQGIKLSRGRGGARDYRKSTSSNTGRGILSVHGVTTGL